MLLECVLHKDGSSWKCVRCCICWVGGTETIIDLLTEYCHFGSVRHYCDVLLLYFTTRNTVTGWILVLLPPRFPIIAFPDDIYSYSFSCRHRSEPHRVCSFWEMYCPFTAFVGVSIACEEKTLDKCDNHAFSRIQYPT